MEPKAAQSSDSQSLQMCGCCVARVSDEVCMCVCFVECLED